MVQCLCCICEKELEINVSPVSKTNKLASSKFCIQLFHPGVKALQTKVETD